MQDRSVLKPYFQKGQKYRFHIPASCDLLGTLKPAMIECNPEYSMTDEDTHHYDPGWYHYPENLTSDYLASDSPFVHHSQEELGAWPIYGHFTTYHGSGYVAKLPEEKEDAVDTIQYLKDNDWLTLYTRAVVVEFTVYNANMNLFGHVMLLFETPATGGGLITFKVNSFRVYTSVGEWAKVITVCQLMSLVLFLYYVVGTIRRLVREKRKFIRELGNWADVLHVMLGLTVVAYFAAEVGLTREAVDNVFRAKGNVLNVGGAFLLSL